MRRATNQDSATSVIADSEGRFQRRGHLFIVADGMGAHAAGELASQMAVERIPQHYLRSNASTVAGSLRKAIREANREIYLKGQSNPEFHNMGTTVSALVLMPDGVVVGHVGDSRVYRLRGEVFEQLTFDHSLVWEMEAGGHVQPNSELSRAIPKNVITRSLGPNAEVTVDLEGPWPALRGDRYLLCSDGLTGQLEDSEIGILLGCLSPEKATRVLIDLANLRGGPDNITIVALEVQADCNHSGAPIHAARPHESPPAWVWVLMGVAALAAVMFAISALAAATLASAGVALLAGLYAAWYRWVRSAKPGLDATGGESGGRGPYRRYSAKPTAEFIGRLAGTVQALRDAAAEHGWQVPWDAIDRMQAKAEAARRKQDLCGAVRWQSEAIIATMQELRHQRGSEEAAIEY